MLTRCHLRCQFRRQPLYFLSAQLSSRLTPYIQVVKSRIQGAEKVPGVIPKYNWTYPAYVSFLSRYLVMVVFLLLVRLVTIFREEGSIALYKGFVPKVLRLAPGGGVLLLVVEFTLGLFRKGTSFVNPSCNVHFVDNIVPQRWVRHIFRTRDLSIPVLLGFRRVVVSVTLH
jgi:Mitochondrial carrier protein